MRDMLQSERNFIFFLKKELWNSEVRVLAMLSAIQGVLSAADSNKDALSLYEELHNHR